MKQGFTHIGILVDRSGSMNTIHDDVIGGLNRFIEEQKKLPGTASVTLAQFDTVYETLLKDVALQDVRRFTEIDFMPRNNTALCDALASLINEIGAGITSVKEDDRPEKVVVVVITDGVENASTEHNKESVMAMVKHQEAKYSWTFVYLGANMDAVAAGRSIGVRGVNFTANSKGVQNAMRYGSALVGSSRMGDKGADVLRGLVGATDVSSRGVEDILSSYQSLVDESSDAEKKE